jgi:K+-sensing histidine kinase KdpD
MWALCEIATASLPSMRHSVRGDLGLLFSHLERLDLHLSGSPPTSDSMAKRLDDVRIAAKRIARSFDHGTSFPRLSSTGRPFIAEPRSQLDEIATLYPEAKFHSLPEYQTDLRLIYPASCFFAILYELITNAVRHSTKLSPLIAVRWIMKGEALTLDVEDNGPGIEVTTTEKFILARALPRLISSSQGVATVDDIVNTSRGRLLYKRSKEFGGTHVRCEFPIVGLVQQGKIYRHSTVYHDE